jgi:hypothetical protein
MSLYWSPAPLARLPPSHSATTRASVHIRSASAHGRRLRQVGQPLQPQFA